MKRKDPLAYLRIARYHGDRKAFTRLLVENRVSRMAANEDWISCRKARENGVGCTCHQCRGPTS
jgi:hypothetical protein